MARSNNSFTKKLAKKSSKTLATFVFILLISNMATLYLWINEVPININSSINSTSVSSNSSVTINNEGNNLSLSDTICIELRVHYLELEQMGDSIIIECNNIDIIVDAGEKGDGTNVVVKELKNGLIADNNIELIIVTHADSDHNGGFIGLSDQDSVFDNGYAISHIVDYGYRKSYELDAYEEARNEAIDKYNTNYCTISDSFDSKKSNCFETITIGNSFKLEFLQTNYYDIETDDNDRSITFILTYKDKKFFFGGDIAKEQELRLLENYDLPKINFYKASHHGSITSNSSEFLDIINPDYIFLNCIEDNQHGIPQKAALEVLDNYADGNLYVTGLNGTITVTINDEHEEGIVSFKRNDIKFINTEWYNRIISG